MDNTHEERIEDLKSRTLPLVPEDVMSEAGRKALLQSFIEMLKHEDGSRSGEDIEDVHDMRVSIRRMRSLLRLLEVYYKPKAIQPFMRSMRRVARALGTVRDLDVLLVDLIRFQESLDEDNQTAFQATIDLLNAERDLARQDLNNTLDKGDYRRFVENFGAFLVTTGAGAKPSDDGTQPMQIRHILPAIIYEHMATIRAYDNLIDDGTPTVTLHALRIEFKQLRYLVSPFADIMGTQVKDFVKELKAIQDHLGRLNDVTVAQMHLNDLISNLDDMQAAPLQLYLDTLAQEETDLKAKFPDVWRHFNTKTVQRQLAVAVVGM